VKVVAIRFQEQLEPAAGDLGYAFDPGSTRRVGNAVHLYSERIGA
jgi:hypothetical protein